PTLAPFLNHPATTQLYPLSLHDALPIYRNFFAVGDEDQSIFSWAGADPKMLDSFRRDFGVTPVVLDRNCRSSRQIFEVARRLVRSEEQTAELQSLTNLLCRLSLGKKKHT